MSTVGKARLTVAFALVFVLGAVGGAQIKSIIKVLGVGAAVQQFGPEINKSINKLANHKDTTAAWTKVVPIISVGSRKSIGAAQVMGVKSRVEKVKSVAQLDQNMFGNDIKIRAMIPIDSKGVENIRKVDGVGISGIVDLRL